ncbi:MAG: hypothetical protein CM1200mP13_16280 [Candidatus Pelagibacterales bacterium]|nr:MAG: hypothetical protein CM1200mP13_16280 [Pelagibacterales bacterium]
MYIGRMHINMNEGKKKKISLFPSSLCIGIINEKK